MEDDWDMLDMLGGAGGTTAGASAAGGLSVGQQCVLTTTAGHRPSFRGRQLDPELSLRVVITAVYPPPPPPLEHL